MANKSIKRNTINYNLKDRKKVVYKGKAKDIDDAASRHKTYGKKFTHIQQTGNVKTNAGAKKEEERQLKIYRNNHGGKNPKYNKTDKG